MDGHNRRSPGRDGRLDLVGIDVARGRIDVHENGFAAVPPDGVRRGHEAVGRRNDFPRNAKRLQGRQQRKGSVGEQTDVGHFQVFTKSFFQLLMEGAVVRYPFAVPDLPEEFIEIIQVRKQGRGDGNGLHIISNRL